MRAYPTNGQKRATDGCIITFENATGERLTLHRTGPPLASIGPMCDDALRRDETYRAVAYSTPETIYGDVTGARAAFTGKDGVSHRQALPESMAFSKVDRREMLHPRIALLTDERPTTQARDIRRARAKKRTA